MLTVLLLAAVAAGPSLQDRIAAVRPTAEEEKWLQIPWRLSVAQARQDAQRQGRPLFLWIMNGSPMGCT